ncbi:MAG: AAA family ATPase, partial [Gammaproteobacteria bacterium]|nr:AAA family ATPase [Gammaproteobacteria bacterium]
MAEQFQSDYSDFLDYYHQTLEQCFEASGVELFDYLKFHWGYLHSEPLRIIGKLIKRRMTGTLSTSSAADRHFYSIELMRSAKDFSSLAYPLIDHDAQKRISHTAFAIPDEAEKALDPDTTSGFVIVNVALAPLSERQKHKNPYELMTIGSIEPLTNVPFAATGTPNRDGEVLVEKSVIQLLKDHHAAEIISASSKLEKNINEQKNQLLAEIEALNSEKSSVDVELKEKKGSLTTVQKDTEGIVSQNNLLDQRLLTKGQELRELTANFQEQEADWKSKMKKLSEFVTERAEIYKKYDLLSEDQLNELSGKPSNGSDATESIDFREILNGDFSKAIAYIQAFLFKRDIFYTQYVLADFMALLRTNDLIILAGESGSGKTNLVKSFAQATGSEAVIIPVKPNWTSSEDLLGYYNPLEKKYLPTAFLGALLKASRNPDKFFLICLDEMNLARVEYYFADFLSLLEEREEFPEIFLFPETETSNIIAEINTYVRLLDGVVEKRELHESSEFIDLLKDPIVNKHLHEICGFHQSSILEYHSGLRNRLGSLLGIPPNIKFPSNVRIIGAINVDETTHYLSPKILDRVHVMRFKSPLLIDPQSIENEIAEFDDLELPIKFNFTDFGIRQAYPRHDPTNEFIEKILTLYRDYLSKLGLEFGMRTVRQAANYFEQMAVFEKDA